MPTVLLAACSSRWLPYRADLPPVLHLPAASAGVRDDRAAFALRFAEALAHDPEHHASRPSDWLHGVTDVVPQPSRLARERIVTPLSSWAVLIVPGLFGDCLGAYSVPFGDGQPHADDRLDVAAYAALSDLGLGRLQRLRLPGRAASAANGARIAAALETIASDPRLDHILLIGYSKGVADTLEALQQLDVQGEAWRKLRGLVSVAGTVMGTPLADHYARTYARWATGLQFMDCTPSEGGEIESITRATRLPRLLDQRWPEGMQRFTITAHADVRDLSLGLRVSARQLARIDPRNDGQMIAADAVLPASTLLAEAATDHWGVALPRYADDHALVRVFGPRADYPRQALLRAVILHVVDTPSSNISPPP